MLSFSKNSPVLVNPIDPVISVSFIWSKAGKFLELPRSKDPDPFSCLPVLRLSPIYHVQRSFAGVG
jgi:hypothetical protein